MWFELRAVIIGAESVGKTSLVIQLLHNRFSEHPQEEEHPRKMVAVDNEQSLLSIVEVPYKPGCGMLDRLIPTCNGFILTYDVTSRTSFDDMNAYRKQIVLVQDSDKVPVILLANKCDLEQGRQVTEQEGLDMANSFGCPFFETSAKDCVNIEEAFHGIVREIRKDLQDKSPPQQELTQQRSKSSRCSIF